MLKLTTFVDSTDTVDDEVILPFEQRQKSRLSALTNGGIAVGLFLQKAHSLRPGCVLSDDDGLFRVRIIAACEKLSVVRTQDTLRFAKACYHLGNRHVLLQILPGELRYLKDHVLDHMIEGFGLEVCEMVIPFEPEVGAYHHHDHG